MSELTPHHEQCHPDYLHLIHESMAVLDRVFVQSKVQYRIAGSLLVAALHGKPHRTIGDIDVILDEYALPSVLDALRHEGYSIVEKGKWGFHWLEAGKEDRLSFSLLLVGSFEEQWFTFHISKLLSLRIANTYLAPTAYTLSGITFTGIPLSSICEGLNAASFNPKRKLDQRIMKQFNAMISGKQSLDNSFTVYWNGIKLPYIYSLFSRCHNLYGGLHVMVGRNYEVWD